MTEPRDQLEVVLGPARQADGPACDRPEIAMDPLVSAWIDGFAAADLERERAGVLLGVVGEENERSTVRVLAAIEAKHTRSERASVTFTHDTWEDINTVRESRYPHLLIVGWFHTHPGLGIFLSGWDLFIQEHFFQRPWQIAYVVDPVAGASGFFRWEDGEARRAEPAIMASPGTSLQPATRPSAPRYWRWLPAAPGFAAGAAVTALILGVWLRPPAPRPTPAVAPVPIAAVNQPSPVPYVVLQGDSLWRIARRKYGDGRLAYPLARANGMDNPDLVPVGMALRLPVVINGVRLR